MGSFFQIDDRNVFFGKYVRIDTGVTIDSFCHMEGVTVGKNSSIGPFSRLRPKTRIAANVHIGSFVEIKNAKIAEGVKIRSSFDSRSSAQGRAGSRYRPLHIALRESLGRLLLKRQARFPCPIIAGGRHGFRSRRRSPRGRQCG